MIRKTLYCLLSLVFLSALSSCDTTPSTYTNPNISSFYFSATTDAPDIENILFTVDSTQLIIYNTDSVAFDANITNLLATINYYEPPSSVLANGEDWSSDSLDYSNPVVFRVTSGDEKRSADYTATVNKHTVNGDEIKWTRTCETLPVGEITDLRAIWNDKIIVCCNTSTGGAMYSSNDGATWTQEASYAGQLDLYNLSSFDGKIFCSIENRGIVYWDTLSSTWLTSSVRPSGTTHTDIIGISNEQLAAFRIVSGEVVTGRFDGSDWTWELATGAPNFPVKGAAKLSSGLAAGLIGGEDIDSNLLSTALSSTDGGKYWTNVLNPTGNYNFGLRTKAAATYYLRELYLFGGRDETGLVSTIYVSKDNGFSWSTAEEYQALPAEYTAREGLSVLVDNDDNIFILGGKGADNTSCLDVWKGRINKADFILRY